VLWSVAKNPLQLPALVRTGLASKQAFAPYSAAATSVVLDCRP